MSWSGAHIFHYKIHTCKVESLKAACDVIKIKIAHLFLQQNTSYTNYYYQQAINLQVTSVTPKGIIHFRYHQHHALPATILDIN